jgi:tRNA modification GTPase
VAIVRVSGPEAPAILQKLSGRERPHWDSHRLYLSPILDAQARALDQGLLVWMKQPHSYTGEDVIEAHLHGGAALAQLVLQACLEMGARLADPGEFTQRAFLAGKIDLAQAEAVAQLIQSRSRQAAQLAQRNLCGHFSSQVDSLRRDLLDWLARLEAEIDFGDEVPGMPVQESLQRLSQARRQVSQWLSQGQLGKALCDGLRVVIVGAPNAGKSTLLNLLLGRPRALVTEIAGTTRDTLEELVWLAGVPLVVVDTAGLRSTPADAVESLGIERTHQEAEQADLLLWVVDASAAEPPVEDFSGRPHLLLLNKSDLGVQPWAEQLGQGWPVSLKGGNQENFWQALEQCVRQLVNDQGQGVRLSTRQWETLLRAQQSLECIDAQASPELVALDLRAAAQALGEIQGLEVSEEVLDRIFSTFCLGK